MHLDWRRGPDKPYVTLWSEPWQAGNTAHVGEGLRYMGVERESRPWGPIKSLQVPSGLECQIRDRAGGWQTPWFQAASYVQHLAYWGDFQHVPCDVEVRPVAYEAAELARLFLVDKPYGYHHGQGQYAAHFAVGPGLTSAGAHSYPNDQLRAILVPQNATAILYRDGGGQGDSLSLEPGLHYLRDFGGGWEQSVSSIDIRMDGWKMLSTEVDPDREPIWTPGEPVLFDFPADNLLGKGELQVSHTFSEAMERQETWSWDIGGSITTSAQVEVEASALVASTKVTAGIEVEIHSNYGRGGTNTQSETVTYQATATLYPGEHGRLTMTVQSGSGIVPVRQQYRNLRTGAHVYRKGWCHTDYFGKASAALVKA